MIKLYHDLNIAILASLDYLKRTGKVIERKKWQGVEAPRPMFETLHLCWKAPMINNGIEELQEMVNSNWEWAEKHFQERVSGIPMNPPPSSEYWPFTKKANQAFKKDNQFSHTYPERIWPKNAGRFAITYSEKPGMEGMQDNYPDKAMGIRFEYGDLNDVINQLKEEPDTRQAYLPIWFPEDTGAVHKGRVPCTLGYLFYIRDGYLHGDYYMRSCDALRHFRDDLYLANRLFQWVRDNVATNPRTLKLGYLAVHIANFHIFDGEQTRL